MGEITRSRKFAVGGSFLDGLITALLYREPRVLFTNERKLFHMRGRSSCFSIFFFFLVLVASLVDVKPKEVPSWLPVIVMRVRDHLNEASPVSNLKNFGTLKEDSFL